MKTKLFLIQLLFLSFLCNAQNVHFPDQNFENALLIKHHRIDSDGDNKISFAEASNYTGRINVSGLNITDLRGIGAFTNIIGLDCSNNQLTRLNVSGHSALREVICSGNALTSLNVANGNNTNFTNFNAANNPNLTCIEVDNTTYSNNNWFNKKDALASYSTNCSATCNTFVNIPDVNFKNALLANTLINTVNDGEISCSEASNYTGRINVSGLNITDLTGIEAFSRITELDCSYNHQITNLNLSGNGLLEKLACRFNRLTNLDLSFNRQLKYLDCYGNRNTLTGLNISNNVLLEHINCGFNSLSNIDLLNKPQLTYINCSFNYLNTINISSSRRLKHLDVSRNRLTNLFLFFNTDLINLDCSANNLSNLQISANRSLTNLDCSYNLLTNLYLSNNTLIKNVVCSKNQLANLDVSNNTSLVYLNVVDNNLSSLDVSNNIILEGLYCAINSLSSIDVTNNTILKALRCGSNSLNSLNVSSNSLLEILGCGDNLLKTLDVTNNSVLENLNCYGNSLISLNLANNNNFNLSYVESRNNPDLYCIQIDSGFSPYLWDKDSHADYSDVCESIIAGGGHTTVSRLFPNPAMNVVNIKTETKVNYVEVYTLEGEKLLTSKSTQNIDVSELRKGIYFVNVVTVDGASEKIKFIKK